MMTKDCANAAVKGLVFGGAAGLERVVAAFDYKGMPERMLENEVIQLDGWRSQMASKGVKKVVVKDVALTTWTDYPCLRMSERYCDRYAPRVTRKTSVFNVLPIRYTMPDEK